MEIWIKKKKSVNQDTEEKKPFKCEICDAYFGKNDNFNQHIASAHDGIEKFKSDICNSNFGEGPGEKAKGRYPSQN